MSAKNGKKHGEISKVANFGSSGEILRQFERLWTRDLRCQRTAGSALGWFAIQER